MLIIGENIHIIAPEVKEAIANRDAKAIQSLAKAPGGERRASAGPEHRPAEERRARR